MPTTQSVCSSVCRRPKCLAIDGQAATIKARLICEQAHQQMKEELGLDHFEGRSWQGLHRHALMTMIAYASSICRLAIARREKRIDDASTDLAGRAPRHPRTHRLGYHRNDARTAENGFATSSGVSESAKVMLGRVLIKS